LVIVEILGDKRKEGGLFMGKFENDFIKWFLLHISHTKNLFPFQSTTKNLFPFHA
jgi:hypothetical protein